MKIGISVLTAGRNAGGPETYEVELVRNLERLDRKNQYYVYCTDEFAVRAIGVQQENFCYRLLRPSSRWLSVSLSLPVLMLKDQVELLHATFAPPLFLFKPLVYTVHCVSSIVHPEFYPNGVRWRLNRLLRMGIAKAKHIISVSASTQRHLQELFQVPKDRITIVYNGVRSIFTPVPPQEALQSLAGRLKIRDPYFLYVGKLETRKNVKRILQAYARYRKVSGRQERLVLVGRRSASFPEIDEMILALGIKDQVVLPGYVPSNDLPLLYSAAKMFVFPSCWEGFGIPILEAMACGAPVLTSNRTSMPEIAGDAAFLVDPESVEEIAEGMAHVASSTSLRSKLIERGFERAKAFTWDDCARQTLEVYRKVGADGSENTRLNQ